MSSTTIAKVTASGQVSLPARVRKRWGAVQVVIDDEGDRLVLRPLPADPIAAARGSLQRRGGSSEAVRARDRAEEAARERRRAAR